MKKLLAIALLAVLFGCEDDVTIVAPSIPEPPSIAGSWVGSARWTGVQGGAATATTSGEGSITVAQNSGQLAGSWEVGGMFTASWSGTITPGGFISGTTTVTVLAVPCTSTSVIGGQGQVGRLVLTASFADPGTVPCPGAPIGLTIIATR